MGEEKLVAPLIAILYLHSTDERHNKSKNKIHDLSDIELCAIKLVILNLHNNMDKVLLTVVCLLKKENGEFMNLHGGLGRDCTE